MSIQVFDAVARFTSRAAVPIVVILGLAAGLVAMLFTGAAEATLLNDPGPFVRFGLPAAKFVFNIAMSLTLGALMFALLILPRVKGRDGRKTVAAAKSGTSEQEPLNGGWEKTLKIAEASSIVWSISAVAVLVLTFADTFGAQAYVDFPNQLGVFLTQIAFGQLWTLIVVLIAVASSLCFGTRSYLGIATAGVIGVGVIIPLAFTGHSVETSGHTQGVISIGLHLLGVTIWLGGLFVIALLGPSLARSAQLRAVIEHYSSIALFAFVLVAFSGVVNSLLRVRSLEDLLMTPYGQVIVAKSFATILFGLVGLWHRRFVIRRLGTSASATREFWRLIVVEFVTFGVTMGLAVALSRSQPPVPQEHVGELSSAPASHRRAAPDAQLIQ